MNRSTQIEFFTPFPSAIGASCDKKGPLRLISPSYSLNGIDPSDATALVQYIERALFRIFPEGLLDAFLSEHHSHKHKKKIDELSELLPLVESNQPENAPCTLCITAICPGEFTSGVGRYLSDTLSCWLVPGKFLNICSQQSLKFHFSKYPDKKFFFTEVFLDIRKQDDLKMIQSNWGSLKKEIRLNILSVKHARQVMAIKKLTSEQKKAIIQENISSVLNKPLKEIDLNTFDQMHRLLLQLNSEDRICQIQEQFSFEQRPQAFQQDIYNELKHFVLLFGGKFTALHSLQYISRLISYQYLFRKSLERIVTTSPNKRHLSFKLMKTQINATMKQEGRLILGIFGAMNVLGENEVFEERHLWQAIRHSISNVRKVENSFILDRRKPDPIRLFYIEIEKKDGDAFSIDEIKDLQKNLPREIKESVESAIHPVFMPRNEEEIMRNILLLSQQLKYVSDLPQVIISFDTQTENELIFRVILLRILKDRTISIPELFSQSTEVVIRDLETKQAGMLRRKHLKQANVFKAFLNKKKYLRKDFSIDLFKARQAVSSELNKVFKGIRDFNGGILSKQQEAFTALRNLLKDTPGYKDLLLENFFYSLRPPLHQSLAQPSVLKALFLLMLESLEAPYKTTPYFFKHQHLEDQLLLLIASPKPRLKDILFPVINSLHIPSSDLSYTYVSSYEIHCLGLIYQTQCPIARNAFIAAMTESLSGI